MLKIDTHVKTSVARTGKNYKDLHEWIDNDDAKKADRHDITKIPEISREVEGRWGEESVREFVGHIHDDVQKRIADTLAYFGVK